MDFLFICGDLVFLVLLGDFFFNTLNKTLIIHSPVFLGAGLFSGDHMDGVLDNSWVCRFGIGMLFRSGTVSMSLWTDSKPHAARTSSNWTYCLRSLLGNWKGASVTGELDITHPVLFCRSNCGIVIQGFSWKLFRLERKLSVAPFSASASDKFPCSTSWPELFMIRIKQCKRRCTAVRSFVELTKSRMDFTNFRPVTRVTSGYGVFVG